MEAKSELLVVRFQHMAAIVVVVGIVVLALGYVTAVHTDLKYWETVLHRIPYVITDNQHWLPIKGGFCANVFISFICMAIGTCLGTLMGLGQIARHKALARFMWLCTQLFRNSPWLVMLYVMLYLFPYRIEVLGVTFVFSAMIKAIIGLSLPAAANVSEIVRGGVQSIETTQWEAAFSLGYTRRHAMWRVILPQAVRRMIPPWMNLYAILTMGTALTNLVGVNEGLTAVKRILELLGETYAIPFYSILLLLFFLYCYPIARFSNRLEARVR